MLARMSAFACTPDPTTKRLMLTGPLTVAHATHALQALQRQGAGWQAIDISGLEALDTAGALILSDIGRQVPIAGTNEKQRALLELVSALPITVPAAACALPVWQRVFVWAGCYITAMGKEARRIVAFMGRAIIALGKVALNPGRLRFSSISHHVSAIGVDALPIVGLIAFLIAVVLAYQGVAQLQPYGGETFTVDLVAISILREMGVLLTAIMVAGRSGSAFTAEIGVMKAREEVDALQVIGADPFELLVVPRLVAIIIALPLLTFFANMLGMVGGYFIISALIDINLSHYLERIHSAASLDDLFVGMIKAPVFAFFIGLIGCMHGLRVTGSSESIGRETTTAVVKGIFIVLVLDAFFSILFQQVGI